MRIFARQAVLPSGIGAAFVVIAAGKIAQLEVADRALELADSADLKIDTGFLAPGLIDLQLNGAFGTDFMSATDADWTRINALLPSTGVTSFYPTVITAPISELVNWLNQNQIQIAKPSAGSQPLGFHLEGPFISEARRGAHRAEFVKYPQLAEVDNLIEAAQGYLKLITLAPELPGSLAAIDRLITAGVKVSVGHSDASAAVVSAAANHGASIITHLFNAQSAIDHRNNGVAGQALIDSRYTLGLIVDLHHVSAEVVMLAFLAAGDRICLVTDAMAALGMPAGSYQLAGEAVIVNDGAAPMRADGTLAGSTVRLDHAVSNCIDLGIDPHRAIEAASSIPARAMGLTDRGSIAKDLRADLVWLAPTSDGLETAATWVAGERVFSK